MNKATIKRIAINIFYPCLSLAIALAIWAIASAIKGNPLVLPMPDVTLSRFFKLFAKGETWSSIGFSLLRSLISFGISLFAAYFCSLLSVVFKPLYKVIAPMVTILRAAPTVAVILILYAFMHSRAMAITVGFLIAFPILYSAIYSAMCRLDDKLISMAKTYKVGKFRTIFNIYFLSISGQIFDASKSTLSLTLKVIIASEILTGVTGSLGERIQVAYATFEIEYLLAWTIVAIVLSFVVEIVVAALKKLLVRWE